MKVLMLRPPLARHSFSEIGLVQEPIGPVTIGTVLREQGHEVRLVDLRIAPDLDRELEGWRPDACVIGVMQLTQPMLAPLVADLERRFPGVRKLAFADAEYGADHVNERPRDFQVPGLDALVSTLFLNTNVRTVPAAIEAWDHGTPLSEVPGLWVRRPDDEWVATEPVEDRVGDYGVPDRTLLGRARGRYVFGGLGDTAFVFTSFGCRNNCRYCPMSKWKDGFWERSIDDVVAELETLTERNVFLSDFELMQVPEHTLRLAQEIERRGIEKHFYLMTRADSVLPSLEILEAWKRVGLRWVFLGLDGHSPERLRELRKGAGTDVNRPALDALSNLGLRVSTGFVIRPDFSLEEFRELRRYVLDLRPPAVGFTVETPLVGTTLFDQEEARLTTRDWSLFDLQHAVLPTRLPLKRFYREVVKLHLLGLALGSAEVMAGGLTIRDQVRSFGVAVRGLFGLWFAARDHERSAAPPANPSLAHA